MRPTTPRPIAGFRNVLVHGYLQVDLSIVEEVFNTKLDEFDEFSRWIEVYLGRV